MSTEHAERTYAPGTPLVVVVSGDIFPAGTAVAVAGSFEDEYHVYIGGDTSTVAVIHRDHLAPAMPAPETEAIECAHGSTQCCAESEATTPFNPDDAEDCAACLAADDICSYHRGVNVGIQMAVRKLTRWAEGDED